LRKPSLNNSPPCSLKPYILTESGRRRQQKEIENHLENLFIRKCVFSMENWPFWYRGKTEKTKGYFFIHTTSIVICTHNFFKPQIVLVIFLGFLHLQWKKKTLRSYHPEDIFLCCILSYLEDTFQFRIYIFGTVLFVLWIKIFGTVRVKQTFPM